MTRKKEKLVFYMFLIVFVVLIILLGTLNVLAQTSFESEASVKIEDGDYFNAQDLALQQAFQSAIEQNLGVDVLSETKVEKGSVSKDNILATSKGYIKNYKIVNEDIIDKSDGQYIQLKIEGELSEEIDDDNLRKEKISSSRNPRVLIIPDHDRTTWQISSKRHVDEIIKSEVSSVMLDNGYYVVDKEQLESSNQQKINNALSNKDYQAIKELENKNNIDLIIKVSGRINTRNLSNYNITSGNSILNARAINVDNGEVISSFNSQATEASSSSSQAVKNAVRENSNKTAKRLSEELTDFSTFRDNTHKFIISSFDYNNYSDFAQDLQRINEVDNIYFRDYSNSLLEIEVESSPNIESRQLLDLVLANTSKSFEVQRIGQNEISLKTNSN